MVIDGKKIAFDMADELAEKVRLFERAPRLAVITCAPSFESEKFLHIKKRYAARIGVDFELVVLSPESTTAECVRALQDAAQRADGIVVQLPLPSQIDREAVLDALPETHDVDAFRIVDTKILPPVAGAMQEILSRNSVAVAGKRVLVIGNGLLVGQPVTRWLREEGAEVEVIEGPTENLAAHTKNADIIALGTGVPNLLTPEMISDGTVVLDAGTSEEAGKLAGDASPACADKASLFTPVPGGIGPITVAVLYKNLIALIERNK